VAISAVLKHLSCPITYKCEVGFLRYVASKTKYPNRLDVALCMRTQLFPITSNFWKLCDRKK
jgi:hypothetical protein